MTVLTYAGMWWADGHRFVSWAAPSIDVIKGTKQALEVARVPRISRSCTNVRGHGGVKRSVVFVHARLRALPFIARFDIRSYYETMDHSVLNRIITDALVPPKLVSVVQEYLAVPDVRSTGRGMVAGGSLSPLLGAIYLSPLDTAIEDLREHCDVDYIRYADDFIIMARTRFLLRRAIARMHQVLTDLRLQVHPDKRFIGRAERGCDFLGFVLHPHRHLEPSPVSIQRLCERARRLHEHGADHQRLRRYVHHWHLWFTSGLGHLAGPPAHETRYWQHVVNYCGLDLPVHPGQ